MLILGILIGLFVPVAPFGINWLRPVIKILLIPITCGIGYELIKVCGRYDNTITHIISAPGMWAQRITTKEPDDSMIEVAIEAIKNVIPDDGSDIIKWLQDLTQWVKSLIQKKRFQRNKKKKFLKSYINDKMAILYSIYLVSGPLWAMITL